MFPSFTTSQLPVIFFLQFLGPHTSAYIPDPSSCTGLVFTYFVAPFQCFRMVPVSCSSGGGEQKRATKTAPLLHAVRSNRSCTTASLHEAVRGYNLKRWILVVDSLIYKTAGRVSAYIFHLLGKRLWKLTGRQGAVNYTLECACVFTSCFSIIPRILVTGGTVIVCRDTVAPK